MKPIASAAFAANMLRSSIAILSQMACFLYELLNFLDRMQECLFGAGWPNLACLPLVPIAFGNVVLDVLSEQG